MEEFIFVGFIKCSGKLENGNPWEGYRIAVGCFAREGNNIQKVDVLKAPCTDEFKRFLKDLPSGTRIACAFDRQGKVIQMKKVTL